MNNRENIMRLDDFAQTVKIRNITNFPNNITGIGHNQIEPFTAFGQIKHNWDCA